MICAKILRVGDSRKKRPSDQRRKVDMMMERMAARKYSTGTHYKMRWMWMEVDIFIYVYTTCRGGMN